MNLNRLLKLLIFAAAFLIFIISGIEIYASNNTRNIIVTGKVTNSEYGNSVANHEVYIISESTTSNNASYSKKLFTDEEGFYYDTLKTSLNKGSFEVYTYDHNNKIQQKKLYFRFIELSASNIFVADFNIYMPYQSTKLQAQFKYMKKNSESRFFYQFIDKTKNENINNWLWDFGDGTWSELKNPSHEFSKSGLYKIKLTVSAIINNEATISSISMFVFVSEKSYYHMGGHCFAGYFPIDMGKAFLFYVDEYEKFIPIDTADFDMYGYYYFYEIPEGNYCIKVQPQYESEFYGKMIPTYYGDKVYWEQAIHISHHQTNWEYDIHLVKGNEENHGSCSISGNVSFGDTLAISRTSPAGGIDFYLLNEKDELLGSDYSDENGNFTFQNLTIGLYWLTADVAGINQKRMLIELSDENPDLGGLEIIIQNGDINMSVEDNVFSEFTSFGKLYPNPASDEVNIQISATANGLWTIEILDAQGRIMKTENMVLQKGNTTVKMNISTLKSGHYIMLIKNAGETSGKQLIISK